MRIKPLNERIVIKFIEEEKEEKTQGGIVLPDTAKKDEKPQQGEVIAIGKGCCEDGDAGVEVGDTVVFDKYAGNKVVIDDEEFVIVSYEDVLAVIEK